MATVLVPAPFRGPTQGQERIVTRGTTVGACLDEAESRHPGFLALVLDAATGRIHGFVKLFLNGELLGRDATALATAVSDRDEIEVLAAIGGG